MTRRGAMTAMVAGGYAAAAPRWARCETAATGTVVSRARLVGALFRDNPLGITGQDAATSLLLPGGDALWTFGDTIEGPFKSIRTVDLADKLSNTAAIVPSQNAAAGLSKFEFLATPDGKRPRQIIDYGKDESPARTRLWPMHGLCTERGTYLYYHRISLKEGVDVFDDFTLEGMGLARSKPGEFSFERLAAPDGTLEYWKGDQPSFGVFVTRLDQYAYAWGSYWTGLFLARTRPASIADLASYEYLVEAPTADQPDVAPKWSPQFAPTAVLFDNVPNEMSASFNEHLNCFVAVHMHGRENQIRLRTAPKITGPWSSGEIAYAPERTSPDDLFYAAKEHPELARNGGRTIYVTYVTSADYVPRLVEIELAAL